MLNKVLNFGALTLEGQSAANIVSVFMSDHNSEPSEIHNIRTTKVTLNTLRCGAWVSSDVSHIVIYEHTKYYLLSYYIYIYIF